MKIFATFCALAAAASISTSANAIADGPCAGFGDTEYAGNCYVANTDLNTWQDHESFAATIDPSFRLTSIHNGAENTFVNSLIVGNSFIGFTAGTSYANDFIFCNGFESCPAGTVWSCGSLGGGGSCLQITHTVVAGEQLIIELDSAKLVIPADVLDEGVEVTVSIIEPETLSDSPAGPGETLISPIYELTFSATQVVTKDLLFSFNYPAELLIENLYARLNIEGGLITEAKVNSDWSIVFDKIASPTEQISVELSATATRFMIVGINPGTSVQSSVNAANHSDAAKNNATEILVGPGETYRPALADHGWIIACDANEFEKASNTACDPSHPDFNLMLNSLGERVYNSDKTLTALGFPMAETKIVTGGGSIAHIIYDPDGRSSTNGVTFQKPGNVFLFTNIYHLAWVYPDNEDTLGWYSSSDKRLVVNVFEGDDVVIHELMHAVQHFEIPNAWNVSNYKWITEALADAVIPFSEADTSTSPEEYRTFGNWRNWSNVLSSEEDNEEYEVSEFWLNTLDSNLSPLPDFYNNFASKGPFSDASGYSEVDEAMRESGLPALGDAYKALILKRNADSRYPHCESVTPSCTGNSCEIITPISAMSASCFDVNVSFEGCSNEDPDIVVTLETDSGSDPNPNIEMMIDGSLYAADTEVSFTGQGRIWAMNTDYVEGSGAETATIKFEDKTNCYIQIERQKINSGAVARTAGSFSDFFGTGNDTSAQTYHSFEDLSVDSYIETFITGVGWQDTIVEPLNMNAYGSTHTAFSQNQKNEGDPINEASASSETSTITESDTTSMTTTGHHVASGSISNTPISATASSSNAYTYAIGSESVELTLTWGCDMSLVNIQLLDPQTRFPETLYVVRNTIDQNINNWECGTKVWTIPPDKLLYIRLNTSFDEFFSDAGSPETFQNTGGGFEIKLDVILPEGSN